MVDAARRVDKRDTRAALRLYKKEKEKVPPKDTGGAGSDEDAPPEFRADTPLSKEALFRQGIAEQDLKPISYQRCLQDCDGHEKIALMMYDKLEKKRQNLIRRCSDERQAIAKIAAALSGVGDDDIRDVFLR